VKQEIRNLSGDVIFTASIACKADASEGVRLGLAVRIAVQARADLTRANLTYADLTRANLTYANLTYANLTYADLTYADLTYANLARANLTYADLTYADLTYADLTYANLARADLTYANLTYADLASANLASANLTYADPIIDAGAPDNWRCVGWMRDDVLSVRVGCRDKRLHEAREYWTGKAERREVMAALDYVEAIAKLRGWRVL
jgi:hypothetical protein